MRARICSTWRLGLLCRIAALVVLLGSLSSASYIVVVEEVNDEEGEEDIAL